MSVTFDELIAGLEAEAGSGGWFNAHCPVPGHGKGRGDRSKSFGFKRGDFKVVLNCFGFCAEEAIIEALARRGLWPVEIDPERRVAIERIETRLKLPPGLLEFNAKLISAEGEVVDRYLRSRGIDVRDLDDIQFHPNAKHKPTNSWRPCMVAAVRDVRGRLRSLHRTFLSWDDPPQKAPIDPRMFYLGGKLAGCGIHLAAAGPELLIGEGIETVASAMKLYRLPGWAAMPSALPEIVREVIILVDNDPPKRNAKGEEIGPAASEKAAKKAAKQFRREGRRVELIRSPYGSDFNDFLMWQLKERERNYG